MRSSTHRLRPFGPVQVSCAVRGGGGDDERRGCAGDSGAVGLGRYQEYTLTNAVA